MSSQPPLPPSSHLVSPTVGSSTVNVPGLNNPASTTTLDQHQHQHRTSLNIASAVSENSNNNNNNSGSDDAMMAMSSNMIYGNPHHHPQPPTANTTGNTTTANIAAVTNPQAPPTQLLHSQQPNSPNLQPPSSATAAAASSPQPPNISYSAERIIGNGSFGVVFEAKVVETGDIVAIKKVLQDKRFKNRELQIMRQLVKDPHPNIVQLQHCFYSQVRKQKTILLFCRLRV